VCLQSKTVSFADRDTNDLGVRMKCGIGNFKMRYSFFFALLALLALMLPLQSAQAGCQDFPKPKLDWSNCDKGRKVLRGFNLSKGRFVKTHLMGSDLREANLTDTVLVEAQLGRASFRDANLQGANLTKSVAHHAVFDNAKMLGANLSQTDLFGASLINANLAGADISEAHLAQVVLRNANLHGADLTDSSLARADLRRANLQSTNLTGANLKGTLLAGTDLIHARGLSQDQLEQSCGDIETKIPKQLVRPTTWPCVTD